MCRSDLTHRRRLAIAVTASTVVAGLVGAGGRRLHRVSVVGASMEPTLTEGDRLLVVAGLRLRIGSVVALYDPRDIHRPGNPGRVLVKRVVAIGPRGLDVRGDAPARSTDSRTFGPVAAALVRGTVVWRYGPAERSGRIAQGSPPRPTGPGEVVTLFR